MAELLDSFDGVVTADGYIEENHPGIIHSSAFGQTFRLTSSYLLTSVKFKVRRTSLAPSGSIRAYLYAHTGTFGSGGKPTGEILVTSEAIDVSILPTSYIFTEFTFDGTYTLQANTPYCIMVYCLDVNFDASHYLRVGARNVSASDHEGNGFTYDGDWIAYTAEFPFYLYGEEVSLIIEIKGMKGEGAYGWDSTNEVQVKMKVDANGILQTS